jgi:hypothetical protein
MCHRLKIQLKPKMKKQELYDEIAKQLVLWIGDGLKPTNPWSNFNWKIEFK